MAIIELPVELNISFNMSTIAILYSFEQKAFHVETVAAYCKSNIEATLRKKDHQYRLIAFADNYDTADKIIETFRSKFKW
jgi:hypothetical protein